jgi:EAL domain-containing protein (putative c-di-GMP-specific phosphodiesterase class I)
VELTEHESEVGDEALAVLAALRSRGLRLAMDDLGSGYSGLARVLRLAPDIIKLDRSLITTADVDPARQALVVATAGFARSMGAHLVAEGIETTGECTTMRELGATARAGLLPRPPAPPAVVGRRTRDRDPCGHADGRPPAGWLRPAPRPAPAVPAGSPAGSSTGRSQGSSPWRRSSLRRLCVRLH